MGAIANQIGYSEIRSQILKLHLKLKFFIFKRPKPYHTKIHKMTHFQSFLKMSGLTPIEEMLDTGEGNTLVL